MLSKSLIQFSVDGWKCVPSLLFTLSSLPPPQFGPRFPVLLVNNSSFFFDKPGCSPTLICKREDTIGD